MDRDISYRKKYEHAIDVLTQEYANLYFEECVAHTMSFGHSREDAESIERNNIAYFAGYYNLTTRLRVEKLFSCVHPVFGAAIHGGPTVSEAFEMGKRLAADKMKEHGQPEEHVHKHTRVGPWILPRQDITKEDANE